MGYFSPLISSIALSFLPRCWNAVNLKSERERRQTDRGGNYANAGLFKPQSSFGGPTQSLFCVWPRNVPVTAVCSAALLSVDDPSMEHRNTSAQLRDISHRPGAFLCPNLTTPPPHTLNILCSKHILSVVRKIEFGGEKTPTYLRCQSLDLISLL